MNHPVRMSPDTARLRGKVRATVLAGLVLLAGSFLVWRTVERRSATSPAAQQTRHADGTLVSDGSPDPAPQRPLFTDVTDQVGLAFLHRNGAGGDFYLPEEMGSGAAFLDYDDDGDMDIYLVQSGSLTDPTPDDHARLFRNDAGMSFVDVTDESGTAVDGYGMGATCADYDQDGDVDILVTRLGTNVLLQNNGDGTFSDVTEIAGINFVGFGTGAAFLDFDRDGRLDLYLANYVDWRPEREVTCFDPSGIRDYCHPDHYPPTSDRLFRNIGDGRFEDVSDSAGISTEQGNGLGVLCADFDGDEWTDLYVANDQTPAFLWINQRDGTFRNEAMLRGCAYNGQGVAIAGMGVAAADLDADGDDDLVVTNIYQEAHLSLRNTGGFFEDVSLAWGFGGWGVPYTGFGIAVFDQNHDGDFEVFIANGAVNRLASPYRPGHPYAEPNQFIRRNAHGVYVDASAQVGPALGKPRVSRGITLGDYDNDGDIDVLITNNDGPPRLLRNDNDSQLAWVVLDLMDGTGSRNAINARAEIRAGGRTFVRTVRPNAGYLTSHDPRLHFGLGDADRIESLRITWPDGEREEWNHVPVREHLRVTRGMPPEIIEYDVPDAQLARSQRPINAAPADLPEPTRESVYTGRNPPRPKIETFPDGVPVATWDPSALRAWCRSVGLPDPPALSQTEPDVADSLMKALQQAADSPGAATYGRAGMIIASLDAHEKAVPFFRKAAEMAPSDFRWPYYLGCIDQQLGRNDTAIQWFIDSMKIEENYPIGYARLAQLYLETGRIDDADRAIRRFVAMEPGDSLGYVGLGRVALARKKYDLALSQLQKALALDPRFFQCHYYLGKVYAALGQQDKSVEHLAICGQLPQGQWFALRDPLDQALQQTAQSSLQLVNEFSRLQGSNQWERMAELAEKIIRRRSNDSSMMGNLASIYCKMGRYSDAHRMLVRAQHLQPGAPRFKTLRAEAFFGEERYQAALELVDEALRLDPRFTRAHAIRGRILIRLDQYDDAEEALRRAAAFEPDVPGHTFALAELLRITDRPDQALPLYQRVVELQPDHPHATRRIESIRRAQQ